MSIMTTITETKTYLDEPPTYDVKELSLVDRKELLDEARSVDSSSTEITQLSTEFHPSTTLLVNTRGIRLIRLPVPSSELEIPITSPDGDVVYLSKRAKKWEGNSVLSDASGKELLASAYQFGPGREPKLHFLDREGDERTIFTKGKWTSRAQEFVLPNGQTFTWKYIKEVETAGIDKKPKKRTFLVLEVPLNNDISSIDKGKKRKGAETRRLAQLVRGEEARTPGTRSSDAGNGGELRIDGDAVMAAGLREDVVVATCLMMLKKEGDRRRTIQFMVLMTAVGGVS